MAAEQLGTLAGKRVLVLGAGEMGEGIAQALAGSIGSGEIMVANRSRDRATRLARRIGGRAVDFGALAATLETVDLLLASTGSPSVLIEADDLEQVMEARGGRPLLIADVAVPRDVAPSAAAIPGVTLLDMDDLKAFAQAGIDGRRQEIAKVEAIIGEEVERYLGSATEREVAPLVADLRTHADEVRLAELERFGTRLAALDDRERAAVEALTRGIVAKLLHEPTMRLKTAAGSQQGERLAEAVRSLFDI
jgi:glutamyl-tRNA reductase